ncbi:MAG: zf-HC2 domain-containing protein [Actinobacteria bacterium]|nr:zf-HC2 domain-containing protein [Actinomycetota bacterium]
MISCEEAVDRLWHFLERELEDDRRADIEQHLAFCRRCCGELEFAQELRAFLAEAARPRLPQDVEGRLVGFIDELEGDAAATGEGGPR